MQLVLDVKGRGMKFLQGQINAINTLGLKIILFLFSRVVLMIFPTFNPFVINASFVRMLAISSS